MAECNFDRDCTIVPIPRKCVDYCLEKVLSTATLEEKQLIIGLSKDLAIAIYEAYQSRNINSFDDLRQYLSPTAIQQVTEKFLQINQYQLNYFRKPRSEREIIIRRLRDLDL